MAVGLIGAGAAVAGTEASGKRVSLRVGENVGLSVTGSPKGDCVGVTSSGNATFEGIAVGEKVGPSVDGALEGLVDGCTFCNEVGKVDGPIVGPGESEGLVEGIELGESLISTPVDHSSKTPSSPVAMRVVPLIKSLLKP